MPLPKLHPCPAQRPIADHALIDDLRGDMRGDPHGADGAVAFTLHLAPRCDWARAHAAPVRHAHGATYCNGALQLACSHRLTSDGRDLAAPLRLATSTPA